MLGLAKRVNARLLLASTSEVYGDPKIHPQTEDYKGSVNCNGVRACYDEGKRIAETLCCDYKRVHNTSIRIARIFNTFGPRMLPSDGRVISNFIVQALRNNPITVYGEGLQTRSFCYVDDLVKGLQKLMNSDYSSPVNLGNTQEFKIIEIAKLIRSKINPNLEILYKVLPKDDPLQRKPALDLAIEKLKWEPLINFEKGLDNTIDYFKSII